MAISNGYVTLADAVQYVGRNEARADAELEDVISSVSRMIDSYCGREFFATSAQARVFKVQRYDLLDLGPFNDVTAVTTLKTDENGDGTYERTISAADFELGPSNAPVRGRPYRYVKLLNSVTFPIPAPSGRKNLIQITGNWGFTSTPPEVKQACRIMVAEVAKLADAPLGVAGYGEFGVFRVSGSIPPRARQLLDPFRHPGNFGLA